MHLHILPGTGRLCPGVCSNLLICHDPERLFIPPIMIFCIVVYQSDKESLLGKLCTSQLSRIEKDFWCTEHWSIHTFCKIFEANFPMFRLPARTSRRLAAGAMNQTQMTLHPRTPRKFARFIVTGTSTNFDPPIAMANVCFQSIFLVLPRRRDSATATGTSIESARPCWSVFTS